MSLIQKIVHPLQFPYQIKNLRQKIQIIKCLNQINSENKPYNLRLCTFILHKFQEKNLNLNRDSNSDLLISSLELEPG